MRNKQIITGFKNLKEFKNKYDFLFNFRKLNIRSSKEVNAVKHGKFLKINNDLFIKLPSLTKKFWTIVFIILGVFMCGGAATITAFNMPHNVTLKSDCLEITKSNKACLAYDYKCTFKIKDDVIQSRYMDNIDVDKMSIKANGNVLPPEAFSFVYQTNAKNELTINKKYIKGNIEISADLSRRTQSQNVFFFEYDVDDYARFSDATFKVFSKGKVGIVNDFMSFVKVIDVSRCQFLDKLYLRDGYDMAVIYKGDYFVTSFSGNMFFVREDNAFEVTLKSIYGRELPKNIWIRSNARYTKKDEDFTIKYSNDYREATISVPYFFIRDNGSIRLNPDVEG